MSLPMSSHRFSRNARALVLLISALAIAIAAGCGGARAAAPVNLDGTWPEKPGSYRDVHEQWTRHGSMRTFESMVFEVYATFKSPAWRAAHANHMADRQNMSNAARTALLAQTRQASETEPYEVHLLLTTQDRRENDLIKGKRSVWRVVLVDQQGNEIEPISIQRDRRPDAAAMSVRPRPLSCVGFAAVIERQSAARVVGRPPSASAAPVAQAGHARSRPGTRRRALGLPIPKRQSLAVARASQAALH